MIALAAFLVLAAAAPHGPARPADVPKGAPPALAPDVVGRRYLAALASLRRPRALSFDYTVEQLGLRNMQQAHRVFRSARSERDETLAVDGYALKRPSVRILNGRIYRYDVAAIAPTPATYAFRYRGAVAQGGSYGYVFAARRRTPGAFAVSEVVVDGRSFLPAIVRFRIAGGGARGSGELDYGRADTYWVIREARVAARLTKGGMARERIVWSAYRFPVSLPPSTFELPPSAAPPAEGDLTAPQLPPAVPPNPLVPPPAPL